MKRYIAIDLGTTNTVVSVTSSDGVNFNTIQPLDIIQYSGIGKIQNEYKSVLPSKIYVNRDGKEYYGKRVVEDAIKDDPKNLIQNMKLKIGLSRIDHKTEIKGKVYDPVIVASKIIKYAIENSSIGQITPHDKVVITTPASFSTIQNSETIEAAILAGIPKEALLEPMEEPVAGLFDYIRTVIEGGNGIKEKVLVVDIGGGTTDIVLINLDVTPVGLGKCELVTKSRFDELGGVNFDYSIAKGAIKKALGIHDDDELDFILGENKNEIIEAHLGIASNIKELLIERENIFSNNKKTQYFEILNRKYPNLIHEYVELSYDDICEFTSDIWSYEKYQQMDKYSSKKNIFYHIYDALRNVYQGYERNPQNTDLTMLYLVGGMTSFKVIGDEIKRIFGNVKIVTGNKMEAISKGACYYISRSDVGQLNIDCYNLNLLSDSYLLDVSRGLPVVIAKKGVALPYQKTEDGFMIADSTNELTLSVLFGEDHLDPNLKFESTRIIQTYNHLYKNKIEFDINLTNMLFDLSVRFSNIVTEKLNFEVKKSDLQSRMNVFSKSNFPKSLMHDFEEALDALFNFNEKGKLRTLVDQVRREFQEIPFVEIVLYLSLKYNTKEPFLEILCDLLVDLIDLEFYNDKPYFTDSIKHIAKYWITWRKQLLMLTDIIKRLNPDKFSEAHETLVDYLLKQRHKTILLPYFTYMVDARHVDSVIKNILSHKEFLNLFDSKIDFQKMLTASFKYMNSFDDLNELENKIIQYGQKVERQFEDSDYFNLISQALSRINTSTQMILDVDDFIVEFKKAGSNRNNLAYNDLKNIRLNTTEDIENIISLFKFLDSDQTSNPSIMAKLLAGLVKNNHFKMYVKNSHHRTTLSSYMISVFKSLRFYSNSSPLFGELLRIFITGTLIGKDSELEANHFVHLLIEKEISMYEYDFYVILFKENASNPFFSNIKTGFKKAFNNDPIKVILVINRFIKPHSVFFYGLVDELLATILSNSYKYQSIEQIIEVYYDLLLTFKDCNKDDLNKVILKIITDVDGLIKNANINSNVKLLNKRREVLSVFRNESTKPEFVGNRI